MINCIIIDDEPLAVKLLENHISKIEEMNMVGTGKNALEAYRILQQQQVDLMYLDIQMPDLSGIEFLKSLNTKPKTVFTTAYRDYAVEGFELEAVDYLLKPITFDRFFKSAERILRSRAKDKDHAEDFVVFRSEGFNIKILLKDILYFESQGNDIKVHLINECIPVSKVTISELTGNLQDKGFVRIHRSFIVNSSRVTAISNNEILAGRNSLPVGRSYKKEFEAFAKVFLAKRCF